MKINQANMVFTLRMLISSLVLWLLTSCAKEYTCSCASLKTSKDTLLESVKTTKLGLKGFEETCKNKESDTLLNCKVE